LKVIVIHPNVDIDAIVSAWLVTKFEGWETLVGTANDEIPACEIIILDMPVTPELQKYKVILHVDHHDGSAPSTAAKLKEIYSKKWEPWMDTLVDLANAADQAEVLRIENKGIKLFHLTGYLNALRTAGYNDHRIINEFFDVLDRYEPLLKKIAEAEELAAKASIYNIAGYEIAYVADLAIPTAILFEKGCAFIIFKDGNNFGIMRNALIAEPSLTKLKPEIEKILIQKGKSEEINEWFFHPAGFIAARGTRKHPAKTSSCLDVGDLLKAFERAFRERVC